MLNKNNTSVRGPIIKKSPAKLKAVVSQKNKMFGNKPLKAATNLTGGFLNFPTRLKKIAAIVFIMVFASVGSYLLFRGHAATNVNAGVYTGPAKVTEHDTFSNWLGSPVTYASDYIDYRQGWSIDFTPNWLTDSWGAWVKAVPGRRLTLGVPLLEESARGQFDLCANGSFDTYFQSLGQNLVSKGLGSTILRLGYEMNNPGIGPWEATSNPTGFKNCFSHVVNVMRSVPNSAFIIDWCTNAGVPGGSTLTKFDDYYPGDSVVDYIGMDQYDIIWQDTTSTPDQRWNYLLTRPMGLNDQKAFATVHAKPMSFPEWGLYAKGDQQGGGGDNPYYIDRMADWFAANNVAYQSYFNVSYGGGILSDFPNGQAEYKARFGGLADTSPPSQPNSLTSTSTSSQINLTWTASTDNTAVTAYDIYRNSSKVATVATNSYTDTGLTASTTYSYYVIARDGAGNSSPASAAVSATTLTQAAVVTDTTAPTVSVFSPKAGITVSSNVAIYATASDNVKVTKLEIYIDGSLKTSNTNANAISYVWGTKKVKTGSHTITIKAYDGAGNIGQSSVTVFR